MANSKVISVALYETQSPLQANPVTTELGADLGLLRSEV